MCTHGTVHRVHAHMCLYTYLIWVGLFALESLSSGKDPPKKDSRWGVLSVFHGLSVSAHGASQSRPNPRISTEHLHCAKKGAAGACSSCTVYPGV